MSDSRPSLCPLQTDEVQGVHKWLVQLLKFTRLLLFNKKPQEDDLRFYFACSLTVKQLVMYV